MHTFLTILQHFDNIWIGFLIKKYINYAIQRNEYLFNKTRTREKEIAICFSIINFVWVCFIWFCFVLRFRFKVFKNLLKGNYQSFDFCSYNIPFIWNEKKNFCVQNSRFNLLWLVFFSFRLIIWTQSGSKWFVLSKSKVKLKIP